MSQASPSNPRSGPEQGRSLSGRSRSGPERELEGRGDAGGPWWAGAVAPRLQAFGNRCTETVLVVVLVGISAVVRWLDLWTLPIFTDEGDEIGLALRIVRDGARPLTNDDPYLGPLFNYLLAGVFWLVGPSPWLPRALMLGLGAATIVPTYLLARELAAGAGASRGRAILAGVLAAGLLAVNAGHVIVNSHVAWGNCVTPLFATTAGWLLVRSARLGGRLRTTAGLLLVLGGLAFGLALQTHPSVAALLPGVGLYILWRHWRWLVTPWPYFSAAALLAAQAPTLLFINQSGLAAWLGAISEKQEMYERDGALGLNEVVQRVGQELQTLGVALGGLLNDRDTPLPPAWHPSIVLAGGLATLALVWLVRRAQPLIPLVVLSGLLLLPLVNGKYAPLVSNARYLMPLVIVALAAIGAYGAMMSATPIRCASRISFDSQARSGPAPTSSPVRGRGEQRIPVSPLPRTGDDVGGRGHLRRLVPLLAVLVLLGASAVSLAGFSLAAHRDGRTNARLLGSLTSLEAAYRPGDTVTIDRATYRDWSLTEGRLQRVFESWLDARGIQHRVVDVDDGGRLRNDLAMRGGLVVLARRTVPAASRGYQLEEIAGDSAAGAPAGTGYSIVRARRAGGP